MANPPAGPSSAGYPPVRAFGRSRELLLFLPSCFSERVRTVCAWAPTHGGGDCPMVCRAGANRLQGVRFGRLQGLGRAANQQQAGGGHQEAGEGVTDTAGVAWHGWAFSGMVKLL